MKTSTFTRQASSLLVFLILSYSFLPPDLIAQNVGKWRRHVISISNASYSGNPFELEIDAVFTHTSSGTTLETPGYYAGNDTWKVAFMPTRTGEWTYETSSSDPQLNGVQGSLNAVNSGHKGMLKADPDHPKKWKYVDGENVLPIGVFVQIALDTSTPSQFAAMADFLEAHNIQLVNFRLSESDWAFSNVNAREMDLAYWDQLEERMEMLTERGLGADMMLYTDNPGTPSFDGQSAAERLLIRYMVARLASFPILKFNSGIDINEYRSEADIDWMGEYIQSLDPYGHPVSSRRKGNAYTMETQTYNSVGDRNSAMVDILDAYEQYNIPGANNDNWGEDKTGLNGHTPADIRRSAWKSLVGGGIEFHVRHNISYCPWGETDCDKPFTIVGIQDQLDSEDWLALVNPFIQSRLGDTFADMEPAPSVVNGTSSNGHYCIADAQRTKILCMLMGKNDTWDNGNGSAITIKASGLNGSYDVSWFDPRTGNLSSLPSIDSGSDVSFSPPDDDDWILLLENEGSLPVQLTAFEALTSGDAITLKWNTSSETNNAGFEIERAVVSSVESPERPDRDAIPWQKIAFVEGHGSTTEAQNYEYVDAVDPLVSSVFLYRLKQIDFDGRFEYSEEIEVTLLAPQGAALSNYPNPFNPNTTIHFAIPLDAEVNLKVYDASGREVRTLVRGYRPAGWHEVQFDASELPSGVYFYTLQAGDIYENHSMTLLK